MLSLFILLFHGLLLLFGLLVKGFFLMIRRFDITNSLIVGGGLALTAHRIEIYPAVKWSVIILLTAGCFVLQHFFIPARIVFGVLSSALAGFVAYGIYSEAGFFCPYIPMGIAALIVGVLNLVSWLNISVRYKRD